jgi:gas vesicle protein
MEKKNYTIESLIAGGFIGAALGAWLSKDKEESAITGALLGAAFSATFIANQEAKKTNQPVLITENGKLFRQLPSGEKQFVKELPKSTQKWEEHFKLK